MKIQNATLTTEQLGRIQKLVIDMGNKMACSESTGIDTRTIDAILTRGWGSTKHITLLLSYCDGVESFSVTPNAE